MSTIKIEFETTDLQTVSAVSSLVDSLLGVAKTTKETAKIDVVDAEEVVAEIAKKVPAQRASRAKAKAVPVVEEPEDDEDEDSGADEETTEEDEEESITADDLRALQATKIDKHRADLKAQYNKLGATGIKDLQEKHYQKMFDFMSKLK